MFPKWYADKIVAHRNTPPQNLPPPTPHPSLRHRSGLEPTQAFHHTTSCRSIFTGTESSIMISTFNRRHFIRIKTTSRSSSNALINDADVSIQIQQTKLNMRFSVVTVDSRDALGHAMASVYCVGSKVLT